ncbi:MAG: aminopeptidase P family protein [Alphaproteobacteria bacterium]|nr:aminopeptidase P family protein [Alphaproteobacteria bacterium]
MELVRGVLAAPEGLEPDSWFVLVAPKPDAKLCRALAKLRQELAATPAVPLPLARLKALRDELKRRGLDGFLVPHADEHQGEYLPPRAERLAWLTGFTGSAGAAAVMATRAALFVDGRYTLQARTQVDPTLYEQCHLVERPLAHWLRETLKPGERIGYDPWLHTASEIERLHDAATKAGAALVACDTNPLDAVWASQPPPPLSPVVPHPIAYSGKESAAKRTEIAALLAKDNADALVITQPDNIAWLLNIRGGDVPHTPLALAFALLKRDATVELFIDKRKLAPGLDTHLGNAVSVNAPGALLLALDALNAACVQLDANVAASAIVERLNKAGAKLLRAEDPITAAKACKNPVELAGTRVAHRRDGAALSRFLAWIAAEAPKGGLTEIAASDRLAEFRRATGALKDLSFDTISGAGPNGAVVHYRATKASNRRIEKGQLYLVDSGAQYADGTTDVTRTVAIGTPTAEMRDRFTRVLKGHIALALARFPVGTNGGQLDALARQFLWQVGLDYDHGTGHGVGSYLGVHEGPQRIAKRGSTVAFKPGMIVSNEPGYYKTDAYGIRLENLVVVTEATAPAGAERPLLGFETLTLAPIDRALVEMSLMSTEEIAWLDAYHARVLAEIGPQLDGAPLAWLMDVTRPL